MPPSEPYGGRPTETGCCLVLVLARPGFVGDYIAYGLRQAGMVVTGPVATATLLEDGPYCGGAVVDVELDGRELFPAVERLSAAGVPMLLIGGAIARWPVLLRGWPMLVQPFASYQIVDHLRDVCIAVPDPPEPLALDA